MTEFPWPADAATRWSRRALRAAGRLVPAGLRDDWLSEWEAELWELRRRGSGVRGVAAFLAGAWWHAAWERKEGWRMEALRQDVRYAARTLSRSPGFTSIAVLMLGLAIGANTALFSVVEAALLSEAPYAEPDRLVVVDMLFGMDGSDMRPSEWSYPRYRALGEELRSVDLLAGYASRTMTLTDLGEPAVIPVEVATPSLFPLLGLTPVSGRLFGPAEEDDGSARLVALVSHAFWRARLGGSPGAVGSSLTLDRLRFEVMGVLPEGFDGVTGGAEIWIPMSALREVESPSLLDDPWNQHFRVLGRLAPGASLERARGEAQAFGATVMERFPAPVGASRLKAGADVVRFVEARRNPAATASMVALFAAVALVLLITTANLAGLLLARLASRRREAAIRASLGAGRARLLRQLLTESLLLAAAGGAVGVALAWMGVDTLGIWLADALGTQGGRGLEFLDTDSLSVNWKVLAFATVLTAGVGIAVGLLPAWHAARTDPNEWLKGRARRIAGGRLSRLNGRDGLIAAQVAVAVVLLAAASLMVRGLIGLQRADPGYDPRGLLTATYTLSTADEQAGIDPGALHVELLNRIRSLPGATAATLGEVPMGGPTWRTIVLGSDGRPELTPAMHTWIRLQPVADGHFAALRARLIEGRDIAPTDDWNTDRVIVLSRMAAKQLFPEGGAVGRRIQLGWSGYGGDGAMVVGVVEGLQLDQPGQPEQPQGYVPVRQAPKLATGLMIRTRGEPEGLIPAVRATLAELAPGVALTSVMSMDRRASGMTARPRVVAVLLSLLSVASLLLVAAGLYGSIAFAVAQRTGELGLRASLGANRASLAALVVRQGMGVTLVGIVVGIVASLWATRFLRGVLDAAASLDPSILLGATAGLILVAGMAAYLPARRATRIDPMRALRSE